ncbi:MAG: hypothetical protein UT34_C0001G0010 [candidate division WS6 bacterium GW2011_GWF2_39_15]|uniref:Uncharacterized protein n=1 Tax=candidate division WS6 bacterium GW2011_GWF2_39_15 TaxID=1619100 RepID=A0A0G0Q6C1_9BACT|nr:MAG: hypothetical protein UT34_C0001G0010 [candidate division WS6 bacterium GW2011_GWF2_39_15]
MLKKMLCAAVIGLFALGLFSPMTVYAEDVVDDAVLYNTQDDTTTSTDDSYNYDWETEWNTTWNDLNNTETTTDLTDEEAAALGVFATMFGGAMLVISLVFALAGYIYYSLTLMVTAKKLNVPNTWMAWVPIANVFLAIKCADQRAWTFLLFLVPLVNLGYAIYIYMKIAERRGFQSWLGLLMLVPIANIILPGYLAWAEPKKSA